MRSGGAHAGHSYGDGCVGPEQQPMRLHGVVRLVTSIAQN